MREMRMAEHGEEVLSTDELSADGLSTGELLVEEVSIDGMCGVY
jgi:mycofactocin precursor